MYTTRNHIIFLRCNDDVFQMIHGNKTLNDDVEKNRQKIFYKNLKIEK